MPIFKIDKDKLEPISEKKIDLERDIQKLTEQNLETIFGLKFVSGSLNQEFSVHVNEQDFYIDTLAWNEDSNSLVIIEYKKTQSFSIIDQGYAYLSAMLNNQAEFVLELNERLKKNFGKKDIDWEQSRIIFISPEFTNYQKNAINFKDLPMYLYEVKIYENGLIDYNPIQPVQTSASIKKITKDKTVQAVSKQVKVYSPDDLIPQNRVQTREIYEELKQQILSMGPKVSETTTKFYIAYKLFKNGQRYNFAELIPQASGVILHLDIVKNKIDDPKNLVIDCKNIGHWATGDSKLKVENRENIDYIVGLIKQTYDNMMKDDQISWHKGSGKV